jgi:hypothetical protein
MQRGQGDLREEIIRSYWGPVARPRSIDEASLWERIEIYMLSLLLDDYSLEKEIPKWLVGSSGEKLVKARVAIKLERALDKLVEYLRLLEASPHDVNMVAECRDSILLVALSRGREREQNEDDELSDLEAVISKCYKVVKLVECKYFSRNRERCLSKHFGGHLI